MLYESFAKKMLDGGFGFVLFFFFIYFVFCFKKQSKELLLVPGMQSFNLKNNVICLFDIFL